MASKRKYAYYLKGNNIAVIEENIGSGVCSLSGYSNQTTCEAAGGTWTENAFSSEDNEYKSPVTTIDSGLEIQYAYSPIYNVNSLTDNAHKFIGWGSSANGKLMLFTYKESAVKDMSSDLSAGNWIYITGSGRWSGLHQVDTSSNANIGIIVTKTRVHSGPPATACTGTYVSATKTFNGDNDANDYKLEAFKDAQSFRSNPYVWVYNAAQTENNGFFSYTIDDTVGQITFKDKITIDDGSGNYTSTAASIGAASADTIDLFAAYYEPMTVHENIDVMQGSDAENFELDLNRYQANAVVYYLKAKLAEDMGDFNRREYFMREFKRQLEKGTGALKRGPYIVQGFNKMR